MVLNLDFMNVDFVLCVMSLDAMAMSGYSTHSTKKASYAFERQKASDSQ